MGGIPKSKSRWDSLLPFILILNVFAVLFAVFIGGMATDSPTSSEFDFWKVFFSIEGIPLLILIIGLLKSREKMNT